jgi:hypothetical protein
MVYTWLVRDDSEAKMVEIDYLESRGHADGPEVPSLDTYVSQRRTAVAACNVLLRLFGEPELVCDDQGRAFLKEG